MARAKLSAEKFAWVAFGHPLRTRLLRALEDGATRTPKALAAGMSPLRLENISYHVRTLRDFGFIELASTKQVRGAVEHHYRIAERGRRALRVLAAVEAELA